MEEIVIIDEKFKEKKSYKPIVLSKQDDADYPHSVDCGHNGINMTASEANQLAFGLLQHLGISITDLQRQAFDAGREKVNKDNPEEWIDRYNGSPYYLTNGMELYNKYDSFDDYQNREK